MKEEEEKDKLENITGSGIPVTIKGKDYKLGIFNMRDLADFTQYIKGNRIKLVQKTVENMEEKLILINSIFVNEVDETIELKSFDGVCFMLWKCLQKYQTEMTLEDVDKIVDLDNVAEISTILLNVGGTIKNSQKRAKKK